MKPRDLKRIRQQLRFTQQELADQLGVGQVTVTRWELGLRSISEPIARLVERVRAEAGRNVRKKKGNRPKRKK